MRQFRFWPIAQLIIAFEFLDLEQTPLAEAVGLAHQGVLLEPTSQFNRLSLASLSMLENRLDLALAEVESALALNPNALMYMELIGYFMALLGEWERGVELSGKRLLLIPPGMAYGNREIEGVAPANASLMFHIELIELGEQDP